MQAINRPNPKSNTLYIYIVFLLSPLFAVIIAARQYREVWAKNIIWFFSAFYGLTFVIGNDKSDVNRYKMGFETILFNKMDFGQYVDSLLDASSLDFLQPLITYFISLFTDDFRFVLAVFGFIFGFFLSRNIWNVLSLAQGRLKWISIILIIVFSFIYAVWDINVMRFSLAAHIFFYGAFNILMKKKNMGWLFVFIAPLMHFTFTMPIVVLILYKLLGNRTTIYLVLYCTSFFISEINFDSIKSSLTFLPQNYREHSEGYVNEDYDEVKQKLQEEKNFRGKFYQTSIKISVAVLFLLIYFKRKEWLVRQKAWYGYFSFCLLYLGIFNILSLIPVMNRFLFVGYLFSISMFFVYFQNSVTNTKAQRTVLRVAIPLMMFYFVVKFRIGFEFTGVFTVIGGPITAFFNQGDVALINFLK